MTGTKLWSTDDELFAIIQRELFTCVVGDVMDKMDLQHQFLPPQIQPLRQDLVVIGRAMPVLSVDVFVEKIAGTANKLMDQPFGLMLEALDDLHKNEVYVNTGSSPRNALWGELMSTRAASSAAAARSSTATFATRNQFSRWAFPHLPSAPMGRIRLRATKSSISASRSKSERCAFVPATFCSAILTAFS